MARISIAVHPASVISHAPYVFFYAQPFAAVYSENMPCSLIENWLVAGECAGG